MQRKPQIEPTAAETPASSIDELIDLDIGAPPPALAPRDTVVGEVTGTCHPTLTGRARVRWDGAGGPCEAWLPALHGLAIRAGDRVLVTQPLRWPEPIVVGVIDGFARRPDPPRAPAAAVALQRDEALRVTDIDGNPLVDIHASDAGPVVRLLQADVDLVLPGELRVDAKRIALVAREGEVKIKASDDVIVQGETINLN